MTPRLVAACDRGVAILAGALVAALLCCVLAGVVTRALGDPLIWTDEGSRFLMVWLAVFGWMLATRKRAHVRIRYFQDRLPGTLHAKAELLFQAAVFVFGAGIAFYGVALVIKNHDLEATSMPLSMAWMYAPLVPAGLVTAGQALVELAQAWRERHLPAPARRREAP